MATFRAELQLDGRTATGFTVPPAVLESLGGGRRPAVRVTVNGHTFATTIGSMGGVAKIPVSAAVRSAAGLSAGDVVDVSLELDDAPRTVDVPADLAAALSSAPAAAEFFERLPPSHRKAYATWIEEAKKPETRASRVTRSVEMLGEGKRLR